MIKKISWHECSSEARVTLECGPKNELILIAELVKEEQKS